MRRFDYYRPASIAEAVSVFREHGEGGRILAGGTDLLVQIKEGGQAPKYVVSVAGIEGLDGIEFSEGGGLSVGARALMQDLADDATVRDRFSALSDGAGIVGSFQMRNMATLAGNVCNATPSADTSPPLYVLDATLHIAGANGAREVPIGDFWTGPGATVLGEAEIMERVTLPTPPAGAGSYYERHTPRQEMDIAAVGTAVYVELDGSGTCTAARIALGAVAPTVIRARAAEAALVGQAMTEETAAAAGAIAAGEATPISDQRASAEFRTYLIEVMTGRSILRAAERARPGEGIHA